MPGPTSEGSLPEKAADLRAGVGLISDQQEIVFTEYRRVVLPVDGFAFWVRADLVSQSALLNQAALNYAAKADAITLNAPPRVIAPAAQVRAAGSLHYTTTNSQDEAEGFAISNVIFTSEVEVEALTNIDPVTLYVGEFDGLRFAFSRRRMLYRQAGLFHYQGDALYPSMATQLLDSLDGLALNAAVVSNSLPLWVMLNQFAPVFPSYLVPDNQEPPWVAAHIEPSTTRALQSVPYIDPFTSTHSQLCAERVKLVMYGLRSDSALDYMDYLIAYSANTDAFGLMGVPVVKDEKRTQSELNILAQRKVIEFEVSYYQSRVRELALQYIKTAQLQLLFAN